MLPHVIKEFSPQIKLLVDIYIVLFELKALSRHGKTQFLSLWARKVLEDASQFNFCSDLLLVKEDGVEREDSIQMIDSSYKLTMHTFTATLLPPLI